ncbi:MAG TPA: choice-of-anchor D domain-containing protein [Bryobacteraceae bacterium]|jgi:hypothetical protein|nr:choice-of-anchor D domain-containing protein [Bryobacteraceae bacterium]
MKHVLFFLLPLAAHAQVALFAWDGATETPVGAVVDLGRVAAGDSKDALFRVRNQGVAPVTITTLFANGAGFTIPNLTAPPFQVSTGNFYQFTVRFTASSALSYSANLQVNGISTILLATSMPAASVAVVAGCSGKDPIDFGRIARGDSASCTFALSNPNTQTITVAIIAVSGGGFAGPLGVSAPLTLRPGEVLTFSVNFSPVDATLFSGTLMVETKIFKLTGAGFDPPLPRPTLAIDTTAIGSAQQRTLTMTLAAPAPTAASGLVTLTFAPAAPGVADDPAILFVATGNRKAPFTVNRGDTIATLGGKTSAVFQTGTTAGKISFTVDAGSVEINGDPTTTVSIAATPVAIDSASAVRRTSDLDVLLIGFDNTYTAGVMTFTFFDTAGRVIEPGAIRADFSTDFRAFFTKSPAGSAFTARITFPVTGDASKVAEVEVELTNSAGSVRTQRVVIH